MILQVGVLAEPPIADVAFKGPGPVVNIHVRFEVPRCGERLGAQSTLVRLLLQQRYASRNHLDFNFPLLLPRDIVQKIWLMRYWFIYA